MPTDAFLKAAAAGNLKPVVALAIESPATQKKAVTTKTDWSASKTLSDLNLDAEPGRVFLNTDGPAVYATSSPDPGSTDCFGYSPTTHFSAGDWAGQIVGVLKTFSCDQWTPYSPQTNVHAANVTLTIAPHMYDGIANLLPITTSSFLFDVWGKRNGGAAQQLLTGVRADASQVTMQVLLPGLTAGAWSFALHVTSKTSVSKPQNSITIAPGTVYDNAGPSSLELRSFTDDYYVALGTTATAASDPDDFTVAGDLHSYVCDSWSDYCFATGDHATGITLMLAPHMRDAIWRTHWVISTLSFTFDIWGKLNGGAPQLLGQNLVIDDQAAVRSYQLTGLLRGAWQFALHVTGKIDVLNVAGEHIQLRAGTQWDNSGPSYLEIRSFTTNRQTNYLASGTLRTPTIDLGAIPEQPAFEYDGTVPPGCALTFTARGSSNGTTWTNLGAVVHRGALTPYRYYDFDATFTASADGLRSPVLDEIRVVFGDNQRVVFSTHKDLPVKGALPYIVPKSLSSLSASIELMGIGQVGQISPRLFWTEAVSDLLATGFLKNKAVTCAIGFPELPEADYEPYFSGTWYDHTDDHKAMEITIATQDVWKQLKTKVPSEYPNFIDAAGKKIPSASYLLTGNIIDVMLGIISLAGVRDSAVDISGALSLKSASFPDDDWTVKRELTGSESADTLLMELQVSAGIFLAPLPSGKLTFIHYDTVMAGDPAATLDARTVGFKPVAGNQKNLFHRQLVAYNLIPGKDGGNKNDYYNLLVNISSRLNGEGVPTPVEEIWGEPPQTKEWLDKWQLEASAIEQLIQRMDYWFGEPHATVQAANIPPRFLGVPIGSLVAVDNLRLPAPKENWPGYVTGKRFLLMKKTISPDDFTLTFDLLEMGPTTYLTGSLPTYHAFDLYPAVTNLDAKECIVQRGNGLLDHVLIVTFDQPTDYHYGSAEVWLQAGSGQPYFFKPAPFNETGPSSWIEIPVTVGETYTVYVLTVNSAGLRQTLAASPQIEKTVTGTSEVTYAPPNAPPDFDLPGIVVNAPGGDLPAITGLELFGQGNDTEFIGRDARFRWNRYTFLFRLGEGTGSAGGPADPLLKGYNITIKNPDGSIRRTTYNQKGETYTYRYEDNYADYLLGKGDVTRELTIEVVAVDSLGNVSVPAALDVSNPAPTAPTGIATNSLLQAYQVAWQPVNIPDVAGYLVHASKTAGFTPGPGNLINRGPETGLTVKETDPGPWYLRIAAYDTFGEDALVYAAQVSVAPRKVENDDIEDATITAAKIGSLSADLVNAVDISATSIVTGTLDTDAITIDGATLVVPTVSAPSDLINVSSTFNVWHTENITVTAKTVNRPHYFSFYGEGEPTDTQIPYVIISCYDGDGTTLLKSFYVSGNEIPGASPRITPMMVSNAFVPTMTGTAKIVIKAVCILTETVDYKKGSLFVQVAKA